MPDSSLTIDAIAADCIARRVRMLNRLVTNLYDEGLRPLGLKVSQVTILVAAWKMGTARPAAVCDALQMDVSTLSRNVDRMRARGWLETVPDPDGRAQPFRLTAEGRAYPSGNPICKAPDGLRKIVSTSVFSGHFHGLISQAYPALP